VIPGLSLSAWAAFVARLAPAVLAVALVAGVATGLRRSGAAAEAAQRDLQAAKTDLAAARAELADHAARTAALKKLADQYRDQSVRTRTITKEIVRAVPVLVPAGACPLPDGWRLLHDAAAAGEEVDNSASRRADGGPVAAEEAAETIAENYGTYHELADRHRALQQYVREHLQ
jgi:hypothetical protein